MRSLDEADVDSPDASVIETPDTWLTLGADGGIVSATPFVAVMEVREDVDLASSFATGADRAGVARLQITGMPQYAAWRVDAGELEVIPGPGSFGSLDAGPTRATAAGDWRPSRRCWRRTDRKAGGRVATPSRGWRSPSSGLG